MNKVIISLQTLIFIFRVYSFQQSETLSDEEYDDFL